MSRGSLLIVSALALAAGLAFWRARAATGHRHVVTIENMEFSPRDLKITLGDQVVFTNHDLVTHTATAKAGEVFDSSPIMSGQSWSFTPLRTGTTPYACTFHPVMHGTLKVVSP